MKNQKSRSNIFLFFLLIVSVPFILFAQTDNHPDRLADWQLFGTSRAEIPYWSWSIKDEDGSCTWYYQEQRYFFGFKVGEPKVVEVVYQKGSGRCY